MAASSGTSSVGSIAINQSVSDAQGFACDICSATFTTKIGVGQHKRHRHKGVINSVLASKLKPKNGYRPWSIEELQVLAFRELQLEQEQVKENKMVSRLAEVFLTRSKDAIKGKRRSNEYTNELSKLRQGNAVLVNPTLAEEPDEEDEASLRGGDLSPVVELDDEDETTDPVPSSIESQPERLPTNERYREALQNEIEASISRLGRSKNFRAKALAHAARASIRSARGYSCAVMDWLNSVLPRNLGTEGAVEVRPSRKTSKHKQSKKRRAATYSRVQKLYAQSTSKAARYILDENEGYTGGPVASEMFEFWKDKYVDENRRHEPRADNDAHISGGPGDIIWAPINNDEIRLTEPKKGTAAGLDGITAGQWRLIPRSLRKIFFNLLMFRGDVDAELLRARTVFIPKTAEPRSPADFRPIGITSVIIRQFHRIFAKRLRAFHGFHESQRAFCSADGTAECLLLLHATLNHSMRKKSELHVCSIDIKKAFDSVSHGSVLSAFDRIGCPGPFISYMENVYGKASTVLQYEGENSETNVDVGVFQGDPISPLSFNYIMDGPLGALEQNIGYSLEGKMLNSIAFADDVMLLAGSDAGMQMNLTYFSLALRDLGLEINAEKSHALSIVPLGKEKKVCMPTAERFIVNGIGLKQIGPEDSWKYLGIKIKGTNFIGMKPELIVDLAKIGQAPLKPQQKLHLLKTHVLTKYVHSMVLGDSGAKVLRIVDKVVRRSLRKWLDLPKDTPKAFFHAPVKSGGLGVPLFGIDVPRWRLKRLEGFVLKGSPCAIALSKTPYYIELTAGCEEALGKIVDGNGEMDVVKYWETELDKKINTRNLTESKHCAESNSFLWSKSHRISGRDYCHYLKIRVDSLPTRARLARGRPEIDTSCRAGCSSSETNYHVIQQCFRTKGGRILRHNRVVDMIRNELRLNTALIVAREPRFQTVEGLRIPDLVLVDGHGAMVIDVQVVDDTNMTGAHANKIHKYQRIPGLSDLIRRQYWCTGEVKYEAVTMSYRGIFEKASAELLKRLGFKKEVLFQMSTSVLRGSWLNYFVFNKVYGWVGSESGTRGVGDG